jgi:hypothetical protein
MGHVGNLIEELTTDHQELEARFDQIELQPVGTVRRRELADELTVELVRHSVAEEQYLYPAFRAYVEDGDVLADKELEGHAEVERLLKDLEGRDAGEDHFDYLVAKLKLEVIAHIRDEEGRLFPLLAVACTPEMLGELGEKVREAKETAPTRPHFSASYAPSGTQVLGPGVGMVDRTRDLLTGRNR